MPGKKSVKKPGKNKTEELKNASYELFIAALSILSIFNLVLIYFLPSYATNAIGILSIMNAIFSIIFIILVSGLFFNGLNQLKTKKEEVVFNAVKENDGVEHDFISDLLNSSSNLSKTNFKTKINSSTRNAQFQEITNNINKCATDLNAGFSEILSFFEKFQKNDFTTEIKTNYN